MLTAALSICLLMSCSQNPAEEASSASDLVNRAKRNKVIVQVGSSVYTNVDFEKYVFLIAGENIPELSDSTLSSLLDSFIEEKLLLEDAKERNITLTPEEKKAYIAKISSQFRNSEKNRSLDDIESAVLFERLLIEKATLDLLQEIEVFDEEIKEYYELHKKDFLRAEMVKVSQILLETENEAIEVLDKVKGSTVEVFRKTAQAESKGIEASKGGEMGVFELGQLPLEMEKVIFALQVGEISQVVESSYGYHIFRLDEKFGPELISEEQALAEIEVKILDQKIKESMDQYVEGLKSKFEWHFYQENLSFSYQRINHE